MHHRFSSPRPWALLVLAVATTAGLLVPARGGDRPGRGGAAVSLSSYRPAQKARDAFDGGLGWINTAGPIHLRDLKGKVVLLDFWTYCCINCHHVLPDLAYLEKKYPNQLVVIGVHSGKFEAEKDTANIRKKVAEYKIKHPVVNDGNMVIWRRFGVESWPSLVLIDANGKYYDRASGEGYREALDRVIGQLVAKHRAAGELDETPLHFPAESEKAHDSGLLYPGKVLADPAGRRLFISDTGHGRIVVTDLVGKPLAAIGNGAMALADGPYDRASFNRPQGMCLVGTTLYVADTENHAIRAVDLERKTVATVAGTGEQSYRHEGRGPARTTGLSSPWDLVLLPGTSTLAIAMAGPHQLWTLDLKGGTVGAWAGTHNENVNDGPAAEASFAQPSGLATDGRVLYVADSEGSAIRAVGLSGDFPVTTIAGTHDLPQGRSLFAFGDADGKPGQSRLQHCLGVAFADGKLYVADTYNNKIKVLDAATHVARTLAGSHRSGQTDAPPRFDEPGGLSVAGSILYVADTNNHAIRAIDLNGRKVRTLDLSGVKPPSPPRQPPRFPNATTINDPVAKVAPGDGFDLEVTIALPAGTKLNPDAPMPYLVEVPDRPRALGSEASPLGARVEPPRPKFRVRVPLARPAAAGETLKVRLSVGVFVCREGSEGFCTLKNFVWNVSVAFADGAPSHVNLSRVTPGLGR